MITEVLCIFLLHSVCAVKSGPHKEYAKFLETYLKRADIDINPRCHEQLKKYSTDLKNTMQWAMDMFDASSYIPRGIFSRRNTDLGDFDQCLGTEHAIGYEVVSGKYCTGKFSPDNLANRLSTAETNVSLFNVLSVCFPNGCLDEEIQRIWSAQTVEFSVADVDCQTRLDYSHLTPGYIAVMASLLIYLILVVYSTIYDVTMYYKQEKADHKVLLAFSAVSNGRNLISISTQPGKIGCLDGIRVLALTWIMAAHLYVFYYLLPMTNMDYFVEWYYKPTSLLITHTFVLNVDSFFLMAGTVATYTFLKAKDFNIVSYYTKRYLRLTPPLFVAILIHVYTYDFLGYGPLWPLVGKNYNNGCKSYWWSALLYMQNYINPLETCILSTWHLSVDMQMYLVSPLILIPLKKWPNKTLLVLPLLVVSLILLRIKICWDNRVTSVFDVEQSLGFISSEEVGENFSVSYSTTHTRAPTWMLGVILGYILYHRRQSPVVLNKIMVLMFWAISIAILIICPLIGNYLLNVEYDRLLHALHESLCGPIWCVGVFWIIFACVNGYGGPVNWFLSLPIFEVLSKLSYCTFIVHFSLMQYRIGQMREPLTFSGMRMMEMFIADYILIVSLATVWHLMFEAPVGVLQSLYTKGKKAKEDSAYINRQKNNLKKEE